jgi:hypothetical protein
LLKLFWGWKWNFCAVMTVQAPDCKFNHVVQYMRRNRWSDAKNQAQMLIVHCSAQLKKEKAQLCIRGQWPRTPFSPLKEWYPWD